MTSAPRFSLRRLAAAALLAALPLSAAAQGLFSPVITVNDSAVTAWELDQRIRLLEAFRTPGDLPDLARTQLVEDRLKNQELARRNLDLTEESLQAAMESFAQRANLPLDQFLGSLAETGVAEETLRDFVKVGVSWRDYVRLRFRDRVTITETDIDRAIAQAGRGTPGLEVLLNEIILPARNAQEAATAEANAARLTQVTSTATFEAEARRISASQSRDQGGRLDWVPINNYPGPIQELLIGLTPGEVTTPIPITNGVVLFQLRDIRETPRAAATPALVDYATFLIPGGRSADALRQGAEIAGRVDTCDDLFGVAQGLPPEMLTRQEVAPAEIPQDVAIELARLDAGEISLNLTSADGQALVLVMLCSRTPEAEGEIDRDAIRDQLISQQLAGYSDGLVAELRAAAAISGE